MPQPAIPHPSRSALFTTFALIALFGFGGVLVWSRRMLVEERKWLTPIEFNEAYALCQFLPGPNVINLAVVFGRLIAGVTGSLLALTGLLVPPLIIVSIMALLYARFGQAPEGQRMLRAVAAAAAGLVLGTCAKMARPLLQDRLWIAPLLAFATFVLIGILRWPLYLALGLLVPLSILIAWWRQ
jgi:chromate transporter